MKILVCGGRDYNNLYQVSRFLDQLDQEQWIDCVVHGAARGADQLANHWAICRRKNIKAYPADWETHGKAAGPIRNAQMLREEKPDMVIAFPGGKGTQNMIELARAAQITVMHPLGDQWPMKV